MRSATLVSILLALGWLFALISAHHTSSRPATQQPQDAEAGLTTLGFNGNAEIVESSGLARSTFVKDAVWTHNDSGKTDELFLLKTDGELLAIVLLNDAKNYDWESMSQFTINNKSYLLVADVGDNSRGRTRCKIHILPEPDLSRPLANRRGSRRERQPIKASANPTTFHFTYEDGSRDCEAVCVDVSSQQIFLVEKIFYDVRDERPPGVYVLPLSLKSNLPDQVAKRVADFPPRGVTGMAFSPNGEELIIRNYVNAHLYSRDLTQPWADVVKNSKPVTVVLPLQRQGEAICFTDDSKSVILTSELRRQPIWQVSLQQYLDEKKPATKPLGDSN